MVQLQKPKYAYYRGQVRPWDGAVFHIGTEAVVRGLNVFEGLKGYWQPDSSMGVVAVPRHHQRLSRSAKLLHMPFDVSLDAFDDAVHELIKALCVEEQDIWVRATLYMVEGHWGEDQKTDLVLTAFLTPKKPPAPIHVGVSTWRRANDSMLPARIKTSTNYQIARLGKIEGRERGYSDMIHLNSSDRVAETGGACVLVVRDGKIATPPPSEGALESITVDILEIMAREMSIPFERRPIERTELYIADELAMTGTLTEITQILSVDGNTCTGRTDLLGALQKRYRHAVAGVDPHPAVDLSRRRYG